MDSLGPGGAQRQFVGLACLLCKRGYEVMTATYYDHPFYKSILDEADVAYECFNVNSKLSLPKLISGIRRFKADVLISFQTDPNSIACVAAKACGVKLIVSERNTHQSISFKDRIIFNLYRWADYVVPNSHSEAKFIAEAFPFLKSKVHTITNFVDLQRFHPAERQRENKRMLIMTAASIKSSKNTMAYIKACMKAIYMGCNADFVWYGINDRETDIPEYVRYTDECINMVKKKGFTNRIRLLPKRKDIENAYREADVFCLPSYFEGTPNVICEAMASGLPVIASNVCDNSLYVKSGENGWLFDPNNIEEMADIIIKATAEEPSVLSLMGQNGRRIAEKFCSEEIFVDKYIKLIESL